MSMDECVSLFLPTKKHSQYVIYIAFPPQQWLHERASMVGYTYIVCLV